MLQGTRRFRRRLIAVPVTLGATLAALFVAATSAQASASECDAVSGNLVQNCGFETAGPAGWTVGFGDLRTNDASLVHSGGYGAGLHAIAVTSALAQTLAGTSPSTEYTFSYWMDDPSPGVPNSFKAEVTNVVGGPLTFDGYLNTGVLPWVQYTHAFTTLSNGTAPTISFVAQNDGYAFGVDDVVVTPTPIATGTTVSASPPPPPNLFYSEPNIGQVVEMPAGGGPQTTVGTGLFEPFGVAVDTVGDVFVADSGHGKVVEVPAGGGPQTAVAAGLSFPDAVAVDAAGDVYIADSGDNKVVEVPAGGGPQTIVASGLASPEGVAVDAAGDVFVADTLHGMVVEVPAGGDSMITLASGLSFPQGVAVDAAGDVFIADTGHSKVVEMPAGGGPQVTIGSGLSGPIGVAVDAVGDVFIVGASLPDGAQVVEVPTGGGAPVTVAAELSDPFGIAVGEPPATSTVGAPVTLNATVQASTSLTNAPAPAGTVTFTQGATTLGTAALSGSYPDTATLTTSKLPAGADTVTASYAGDGNHEPSTGPTTVLVDGPPSFTHPVAGFFAMRANTSEPVIADPGYPAPDVLSAEPLPSWLHFDTTTGVFTGKPPVSAAEGSAEFLVEVSACHADSSACAAERYLVHVSIPAVAVPKKLPTATAGLEQVAASTPNGACVSWYGTGYAGSAPVTFAAYPTAGGSPVKLATVTGWTDGSAAYTGCLPAKLHGGYTILAIGYQTNNKIRDLEATTTIKPAT